MSAGNPKKRPPTALTRYKQYISVNLPDNFNEQVLEGIEDDVLSSLAADRKIRGLLIGLDAVSKTDPIDLLRLKDMLGCVIAMGASIGIFGINPGLAAVIVRSNIDLPIHAAGHDLEDLLKQLR